MGKKYAKGFFMTLGISLGIPLGLAISIAVHNYVFIGLTVITGLFMGFYFESVYLTKGRIKKLGKPMRSERRKVFYYFYGLLILLGFIVLSLQLIN